MIKITFLGTSHGVPSDTRCCSSTLIDVNGSLYLIDGGAPVTDLLLRRHTDLSKIKALFTTHCHGDHVYGFIQFISMCNWGITNPDFDIFFTEQNAIDSFKNTIALLDEPVHEERLRFHLESAGTVYDDGNVKVTALPTKHLENEGRPSYALLIEADGKKIVFSGDLSHGLQRNDFPQYVLENEVDFMQCEAAHFRLDQLSPYLEKCRTKQLCFTHFSENKTSFIKAIGTKFGYPVYAAEDGDTITL